MPNIHFPHGARILVLGLLAGSALALEAHPGDSVAPPPGTRFLGLYAIHRDVGDLKVNGTQVAGPSLRADIGLLRLFHATRVGEWQVNPQLMVPYCKLTGTGTLSTLERQAELGDASVMLHQNPTTRASVYVLPGVTLPTGGYDKNRPLSLGENRYKYFVQVGGQTALAPQWTIDGYADVTAYSANADNVGGRLTQKAQTLLQSYLRYGISATTEVAVGVRRYDGGETSLAGVSQNDRNKRTAYLLTASHWIDGKTQLMANWGQDASYSSGFKTKQNIELRMVRVF